MTGNRKLGMIRSLSNLNARLNLGYTQTEINEMSTGQLRRIIGEAKIKHNIKIPNHSRYATKIKSL
jgi:hypothetical protein